MLKQGIEALDSEGLRNFALTIAAIVAVLFGLLIPWVFGMRWPVWPWIFATIFVMWGLVAPQTLSIVYINWMRFGLLLNKLTSPLILGVLFFGILLPFGFVRRIGRDPLKRRFDSTAESYRVESHSQPIENLEKPY
jgi:hypothetical protein